uniref:Neur_chan_LBD domain-containing protein n=1 Tax=Parastrongyloides trichosuri TaxID=131310 RepID=A0A0N5A739_PARTI
MLQPNGEFLPHVRLAKDLLDKKRYDKRVRPVIDQTKPTKVLFTMSLYQILAINDKQQSLDLNVWIIQKWRDEFLGWNPTKYGFINSTILPFESIWLPDTYVYNSVIMNRQETERYINVVVNTNYWKKEKGADITFMYPALYRTTCRLNIKYFPYDQQYCTIIISSWTSDKASIDYQPEYNFVNLQNYIPNEEWIVISFDIQRVEQKFVCCPEPWVLLECNLVIRRKPLYYIVNLVVPTSIITLVAVTGFFTPASTSNERREKLSLGIDALLAMSILMMMVSEQMPTTSDYVPLFGLFYLAIIVIIFVGTIFTAFILNIHLQKQYNRPISPFIAYIFFHKIAVWLKLQPSANLSELWRETGAQYGMNKISKIKWLQNRDRRDKIKKKISKDNMKSVQIEKIRDFSKPDNLSTLNLMNMQIPLIDGENNSGRDNQQINNLNGDLTWRASNNAKSNWRRLAFKVCRNNDCADSSINLTEYKYPLESNIFNEQYKGTNDTSTYKHAPISTLTSFTAQPSVKSQKYNDVDELDQKLRRRYALEWEFLAAIVDRILLIVFSILVIVVTVLMIGIGEAIHLSYAQQDMNNLMNNGNNSSSKTNDVAL